MSFWTALVVIFVIAVYARMRSERLRLQGGSEPGKGGATSAELERELADLRKRLEVLERIVTDQHGFGKDRLAREIDALRDE